MSKQFGVIRSKQQRRTIHDAGQLFQLPQARGEKMASMFVGGLQRGGPIINLFRFRVAGDSIIFNSSEAALAGSQQVRLEVIEIKVKADVTIELAVTRVSGITLLATPNLPG